MRRSASTTTTIANVNIVIDERKREISSFFSTVSLFHLYLLNQISNRMFSTLPTCETSFAFLSFTLENPRWMKAYATPFRPIDIVFQASKSPRRARFFPSLPRNFIAFRQIFVVERLISLFVYRRYPLSLSLSIFVLLLRVIFHLYLLSPNTLLLRFIQPSVKAEDVGRRACSMSYSRTANCILLNEKLGL